MIRPVVTTLALLALLNADARDLKLADGKYLFAHRFAEHPNIRSIALEATIQDGRIKLVNNDKYDVFPKGVIDEGEIFWHSKSGQWIIISSEEEKLATDVGGCSDGPHVIDLDKMEFWTC
uniref:Uncharacterized protein n=1 Tax=uncultured Thiotrichaceae bacterium TaxID=298394 RepID=A0A6S6UBP0_9GAMM|nr:MAG: Unknown protein [uncultured Thiotrichaceae bacterium]